MNNKLITLCTLITLVIGMSAFNKAYQEDSPTNLKVLPKNISHEDLDKTMKSFNMALGVKCNHCHAPKPNGEKGLDFASDANPNKNIAREMIKMTNKINKKHFKHEYEGVVKNISCNTCHNGKEEPFTIVKQ
ncbi:c-type cytochrome [Sphingobacterium humi]|uniref:Photosynthetic reaction center cytochrome c subunit n=1 Tax=Sphingobacterium humi TaxID=1796905 RepID=A0A6N8KWY0_9SPHI|nr:c-type cytochrome [Sphingobacterium humi]MVZ60438.1 c-type cytochrome [Sphingobacterium humi]